MVAPNGREVGWPEKVMICGYGVGGKNAVSGPQARLLMTLTHMTYRSD